MITSEHFPVLDFWFNTVGVNVCAANTRDKRVSDRWKVRQTEPTTLEEYEQLKKDGEFIRGAAVVTGKVWRGDYVGYYLNGIDFDNHKAIEEFCKIMTERLGRPVIVKDLVERTLVEQHLDNPSKLHLYVYSTYPFKNKSSDSGKAWFRNESMPAIEIKSTKSLMFCSPSMHKGGRRYQFLKQRAPAVADDAEQIIDELLSKYDIVYLDKKDKAVRESQRQKHESKVVNEGSRHTELLREMNANLHALIRKKPLEEIKQICISYNNLYCRPPLEKKEFERMWNDSVVHVAEMEREKDGKDLSSGNGAELVSVAEAIRRSSGKIAVKGMIIGLSSVVQVITTTEFSCSDCGISESFMYNPPLFSLPSHLSIGRTRRCPSCNGLTYGPSRHEEKSAITIQLQDEEKQNALESLNVVLFENDTVNVRNGEKAMIVGEVHVVQQRGNSKRISYLFADKEGIEYERPEKATVTITEEDMSELNELVQQPDMIDKLTQMLAPTVIGHEDKKLGVILMYVGAPETDFRGRIHGLFIGPPGTAKTKLARAAKKLGDPQSRYSSTQGASAKSITAVIDKENDSYVLRLGVLPQARGSVCVLNETASLSMEDQRYLFDVMEEGSFTIDKYGFHRDIDSPTTVLGTTNPEGGEWYLDVVEKGQIPLRKELVDRYDLVFAFESLKDKESKINYAKRKFTILQRSRNGEISEDYTFLRKIIEHAKSFNPILSEEAEAMIIDCWSNLDSKIFATNRVLETITRVSIAFARLHFSNIATADIAKKAIDFITRMFRAFDNTVVIVQDPREAACQEIARFLQQNPNIPYDFQDLINYAADNNTLVGAYLGKSPVNNNNSKYRDIADRFKQGLVGDGFLHIENMNPLTLVFKTQSKEQPHANDL